VAFLRAHDPGLVTVKRSVLAAVVVPAIFAIARAVTSNPQVPRSPNCSVPPTARTPGTTASAPY